MRNLTVALGNYPHTKALKAGEIASGKLALDFKKITPANRAFARPVEAGQIWLYSPSEWS